MIEEPGVSLPFSKEKQKAVLGHALKDEKFFLFLRSRLKKDWFLDGRVSQIWDMLTRLGAKMDRLPTPHELLECEAFKVFDASDKSAIHATVREAMDVHTLEFRQDFLRSELSDWLKHKLFMEAMRAAEVTFNSSRTDASKFEETYALVRRAMVDIAETNFDQAIVQDMTNMASDVQEVTSSHSNALTFGLPMLDSLLLPSGNGVGSLLQGDMTILLAPTNVGKTTCMITVIVANILRGKDVLLVTHEGRASDLRMKIRQAIMGMSIQEFLDYYHTSEGRQYCEQAMKLVSEHLEFIPMVKGGTTVEEVEALVRSRQEIRKAKNGGKGFDLLVDDYAAKLTTVLASGGQFAQRQIQEVVYNRFTAMALEHNLHVLTAIQTNREGSKVNRRIGKDETARLLSMEDVMEAWGPMTTATNVISLNRDRQAESEGYITFHICKSRSSEVGWAVTCDSFYGRARTHWYEYSNSYMHRDGERPGRNAKNLLKNYNGREITPEILNEASINEPSVRN